TAMLTNEAARAAIPSQLVVSTVKASGLLAGCHTATAGISTKVASLTEGVLKIMFLEKLRLTSALLLCVLIAGASVAWLGHNAIGQELQPKTSDPISQIAQEAGSLDAKGDPAAIQGIWEVFVAVYNGKKLEGRDPLVWKITGSQV